MKKLQDEILGLLAETPLRRADIIEACTMATDAQQVSNALYRLKTQGHIGLDTDHTYYLKTGETWKAESTPEGKKMAAALADPVVSSIRTVTPSEETPADPAPSAPKRNPNWGQIASELQRNANDSRVALERYIDTLNDPVLEQLLISVGAANKALEEFMATRGEV